jgi:hypothetical protein
VPFDASKSSATDRTSNVAHDPAQDAVPQGGLEQQSAVAFLTGKGGLTPAATIGLHKGVIDPALVQRLIAAHAGGARLAATVDVAGKGLRQILQHPAFDWGGAAPAREGGAAASVQQARASGATPAAAAASAATDGGVQAAAARGTSGPANPLPHREAIQRSFGKHDVGHIQAHTDERAVSAAGAMGAAAFATGDHVAFAGAPTLHVAAHEAAHVIQQRGGVQLAGGVGKQGDAHEQHAEAVAAQVVQGKSSEALLDHVAGGSGGAPATPTAGVQHFPLVHPERKQLAKLDTDRPEDVKRYVDSLADKPDEIAYVHMALLDGIGHDRERRSQTKPLLDYVGEAMERAHAMRELIDDENKGTKKKEASAARRERREEQRATEAADLEQQRREVARRAAIEAKRAHWRQRKLADATVDPICDHARDTDGQTADDIEQPLQQAYIAQMQPTLADWKNYLGLTVPQFPLAVQTFAGHAIHVSVFPDAFQRPQSMATELRNTAIMDELLDIVDENQRVHASIEYPNAFAVNKPRIYYKNLVWRPGTFPYAAPNSEDIARTRADAALSAWTAALSLKIAGARARGGRIHGRVYAAGDENL